MPLSLCITTPQPWIKIGHQLAIFEHQPNENHIGPACEVIKNVSADTGCMPMFKLSKKAISESLHRSTTNNWRISASIRLLLNGHLWRRYDKYSWIFNKHIHCINSTYKNNSWQCMKWEKTAIPYRWSILTNVTTTNNRFTHRAITRYCSKGKWAEQLITMKLCQKHKKKMVKCVPVAGSHIIIQ